MINESTSVTVPMIIFIKQPNHNRNDSIKIKPSLLFQTNRQLSIIEYIVTRGEKNDKQKLTMILCVFLTHFTIEQVLMLKNGKALISDVPNSEA